MPKMHAYLVPTVGFLVALAATPALAHFAGGAEAQMVVQRELSALKHGDADGAFALTSPSMKEVYDANSENFLASPRAEETPFFQQRKVEFHVFLVDGDIAKQNVLVVDDDSNVWTVVYELVRQPDDSWLINGCVVVKSDVLEA